jgi:hypothetical protein
MNILFIYQQLSTQTGGGVFTNVILRSLRNISSGLTEYSYPPYKNGLDKLSNQLQLYSGGMKRNYLIDIFRIITEKEIDLIVYNGSQLGMVVRKIKKKYPHVMTITIFHNLEYKFVLDAMKIRKNPAQLITLLSTYVNERYAILYSDIIVTLNERDSESVVALYKRKADFVLPLCIEDRFDYAKAEGRSEKKTGAFVGSNFYANNKGIKWFCENVSNQIDCKILVIGKGFEEESDYFNQYPNIELIGTVDRTDDYYYNADFIVSPIFDGSGMKTKTAEALMFGKTIFATTEAFEGYEIDYQRAGAICNTAEDFIEEINTLDLKQGRFNEYSRSMFEANYSQTVFEEKLSHIIDCSFCKRK